LASSPDDFERTAVELARTVGERALAAFRSTLVLEFKGKKQDNPVTVLDRETETFLRTGLREKFPEHGLLGEEHADDIADDARYVWVIDPIDGPAVVWHLDRVAGPWVTDCRLHLGTRGADPRTWGVPRPRRRRRLV
jgi:hypothetical protein